MFARKQKICVAIPMDPPQRLLQEPLLLFEKSSEKATKVHRHEKAEEDLSLVVVGSPSLANIKSYSFLLGLMMAFFESSIILIWAIFGDDADPDMVRLFSIVWSCSSVTISLRFFHALDRLLVHPSVGNRAIAIRNIRCYFVLGMLFGVCLTMVFWTGMEGRIEHYVLAGAIIVSFFGKTIIMWDVEFVFALRTVIGVCSAWVVMDISLGRDEHIIYSEGMLLGVMVLSLIFHFYSTRFVPISPPVSEPGTMTRFDEDVVLTQCSDSELNGDTSLIV
jgi:hypothetical protein